VPGCFLAGMTGCCQALNKLHAVVAFGCGFSKAIAAVSWKECKLWQRWWLGCNTVCIAVSCWAIQLLCLLRHPPPPSPSPLPKSVVGCTLPSSLAVTTCSNPPETCNSEAVLARRAGIVICKNQLCIVHQCHGHSSHSPLQLHDRLIVLCRAAAAAAAVVEGMC